MRTVEALLQNVFFHKPGNKASDSSAGADGLPDSVGSDMHLDASEDVKGAVAQSNGIKPSRTAP
jgi:hypothetical protein